MLVKGSTDYLYIFNGEVVANIQCKSCLKVYVQLCLLVLYPSVMFLIGMAIKAQVMYATHASNILSHTKIIDRDH